MEECCTLFTIYRLEISDHIKEQNTISEVAPQSFLCSYGWSCISRDSLYISFLWNFVLCIVKLSKSLFEENRNNFTLYFHYSSARPAPWCGGRTKTVSRTQSHLAVRKWNIYWGCFVCNEIGRTTRCIMKNCCRATFKIVFCSLLGSIISRLYRVNMVQHSSIFFW